MKKIFMAVIALMMTISASAQFYIYFSDGAVAKVDSISMIAPPPPVDYVVMLSKTTLEMDIESNKSAKLNATVTPADCPYSLLWTSSNPEVATVDDSGMVKAIKGGSTTITVTLNTSSNNPAVGTVTAATCVVRVEFANDNLLNTFELGGYALFDLGSPIAGTDTVLNISVGEVTCQLAPSLYYIWDKGITLVSNSLSGSGYILPVETYTYVITDSPNGAYNGYYLGGFDIVVDTIDDALAFSSQYGVSAAPYGQLLDVDMYGEAWDGIVAAGNQGNIDEAAHELYYASQTGAQFFHFDFNEPSQYYNYGNLSYLYLTEDRETGELYYDLKLEWYDHVNPGRWYGLLAETEFEENESPTGFVKPYDMRVIHKQYQLLPPVESNQAPAMMPKKSVLVPKKMIEWDIEKLSNLPRIK